MARTHPYTQAPNNEHARLVASPSGHPAWTPLHKGIATNCTVRSTSAGEENLYTVPPACTSARMHTLGEKVPGRKHPQRDVTTGHNAQRTATTFGLVTDDWHIRTLRPLSVRDLFFKGKKKTASGAAASPAEKPFDHRGPLRGFISRTRTHTN